MLTASCETVAETMLAKAPSEIMVSGLTCRPGANGKFTIAAQTIGGKPQWTRTAEDGQVYIIYAVRTLVVNLRLASIILAVANIKICCEETCCVSEAITRPHPR